MQCFDQFLIFPRLYDKIGGTFLDSFYGQLNIRISGKKYDRQGGMVFLDLGEPEESLVAIVYAGLKIHVEQDYANLVLLKD